jgi:hypothetical protein
METTTLKMFTETVKEENNMIWVRPVCDFFRIDARNQHKNIRNDAILSKLVGKNTPDLGENDKNGRILLTKKGFIRWIQIINPNIIPDDLSEKFIEYQEKISDFLLGTMEEHEMISATKNRLQNLKGQYSQLGNEIRQAQKELHNLLNNRYQYRLPFTPVTPAKQLQE